MALPTAAALLLAPATRATFETTPTASDEFNGSRGYAPDAAIWGYDLGGGGWGNQELQTYTKSPANVSLDGQGHLAITALRSGAGYTSARLNTSGRFAFTYGRVEASIKMPAGKGLNSAFWMLGASNGTVGWPASGEIDVAEYLGNGASYHVGLHGPPLQSNAADPYAQWQTGADPSTGANLSAGYHSYWVNKEPDRISVGIDGMTTGMVARSDLPAGNAWVFNTPSNILLDVAVGGNFAGAVPSATKFPATMLVDYVRFYAYTGPSTTAVPAANVTAGDPSAEDGGGHHR
ncbi:glycoside hydrolase family 16 protein [Mycobacterium yunnanensis]|uniref:Glycoside hydrolase family 16 protein n=1 Tax=Mycobacterium yunnanensis TaxID=368477 RepID=A0A9X2YQI0_9MYCO|nr:glycoside hydrolase family 16 protein [Mycobacterium yunnanensis]MCV7423762.1 glycoside hydrolase family 16 protein [Mycobacterium yunnanensis]